MSSKHEKLCKFIKSKFAIWRARNNSSLYIHSFSNFRWSLHPQEFMNFGLGGFGNQHSGFLLNLKKLFKDKNSRIKNEIFCYSIGSFRYPR